MSKPILYYDETCPLCRSFKAALVGYIGNAIDYKPIEADAKTFRFVGADGSVFKGKDALRKLLTDYPRIAPALNVLPDKWKLQVVNAGLQVATALRSALSTLQENIASGKIPKSDGGCGCGSK